MSTIRQGQRLTFVQGHTDLYFQNIFCCKAAWHVDAKFHVELLLVVIMQICSSGHGHMTKMVAMLIYDKTPLKIFFSETSWPMTFKLGILHQGLGLYNAYSNHDPWLTLTYITARSAT